MSRISVTINNQVKCIQVGSNLISIIQQFDLPDQGCVFAINNSIIPRGSWESTKVNEGDVISLFQAIAGG